MWFYSLKPVTREMWSLHNGPFVRKVQSRNPSGTGTGPVHFQKVQHYAFISPEFFLTSLHSTPPFPGLQRVLLGIERDGLLGRSKGGTGKGVSLSGTVPSGKRDERGGPGNRPHGSKAQRWPKREKD